MTNSVNSHNTGLTQVELDFIRSSFFQYPGVHRLTLFGSRAKGNWTGKSDIDIAYIGELTHRERSQIWSRLTYDAPFLYRTDIIDYNQAPRELREHIDRVGVPM